MCCDRPADNDHPRVYLPPPLVPVARPDAVRDKDFLQAARTLRASEKTMGTAAAILLCVFFVMLRKSSYVLER